MAGPTTLEARAVHYAYGQRSVLAGVDFAVAPGEIVALLGANGAGKSTLLRLCLGLERPSRGEVRIQGRDIRAYGRRELARHVAYVPQSHASPFPYSVRDIVAMGRHSRGGLLGAHAARDRGIVDAQLERLGIAHLAERAYTQVSGGERQLALLCRALVQQAPLLVLDEPASALDFGHQVQLLARLRELADAGYAVIMSTHQPQHARNAAHRVLMMKDGRIVADGAPDAVLDRAAITQLYDIPERDLARFASMGRDWFGGDHAGR
jgi:iron complex transport system ATP-binding protein